MTTREQDLALDALCVTTLEVTPTAETGEVVARDPETGQTWLISEDGEVQ